MTARRAPGSIGPGLAVGLALAVALGLAACDLGLAPTPAATTEPTPTPAETTGSADTIEVDDGLLDVLPPTIDGFAVSPNREAAESVIGDPSLAFWVSAVSYGVVADPAGGDVAVVTVIRIRDGRFSSILYRAYRDSYAPSACEQAGGVGTTAETDIAGRTVSVTTCQGGATIHHVHLENPDRVVSVWSTGEARLGERIVEELRE